MRNYSAFIVTVVAMFLATACYVVPGTGDGIDDGFDYEPVSDDEVSDEVTDNVQKDDEVTDEVIDDVQTDEEVDEISDEDSREVDETPDTDSDIDNNDPIISLAGPIGIEEGKSGYLVINITNPPEYNHDVYLVYDPAGTDTATRNVDYVVNSDSIQIMSEAFKVEIPVHNLENSRVEGNRIMTVRLHTLTNGVQVDNNQVTVILYDNDIVDTGTFAFDTASSEVVEGSKVCVNVMRTGGTNTLPASVVIRKTSGDLSDVSMEPLAPGNYTDGFILQFAAGEIYRQVCVNALADGVAEVDETIEFKLETPSIQSRIDPERNTFRVTIKDTAATEILVDAGNSSCKEFVMAVGKATKCYAYGSRTEVFNTSTDKKYRLKGTCALDCPDLSTSDTFTCNGEGVDQSGVCDLPLGGTGCTHNGDCR